MEKLTGCGEAAFHSHLVLTLQKRSLYSDIFVPLFCTLWSHLHFSLSVFQLIDLFLVLGFYIVIMEKFKHHSDEEYCKSLCIYHSLQCDEFVTNMVSPELPPPSLKPLSMSCHFIYKYFCMYL